MQDKLDQNRYDMHAAPAAAAMQLAEPAAERAALGKLVQRAILALALENPRLLQLGCGSGSALDYLLGCGLDRLSGICEDSITVEMVRRSHPLLFERSRIYSMAPAALMPMFDEDEFDLCCLRRSALSAANQAELLAELARIASDAIIVFDGTIELPLPSPQDGLALQLRALGFEELAAIPGQPGTEADCRARLFRRRENPAG